MEDKFRCLGVAGTCVLEEIRDGILLFDLNGLITEATQRAAEMCGFTSKRGLLGRNVFDLIAERDRPRAMEHMRKRVRLEFSKATEYSIVRADGSEFPAEVISGVFDDASGNPSGLVVVIRDISVRKYLRESLQFYIGENIRAQEEERKRIARELHDDTIQALLLMAHQLKYVGAGGCGKLPKRATERITQVCSLAEETMDEVRRFIQDLRPYMLDDLGLIPALRWLADRLTTGEGLRTTVEVFGSERRLPAETELVLFRIAQEALGNVRKHASASVATVTLEFNQEKVTLAISDNGKGFESPAKIEHFAREGKVGLAGIVQRVRLINGIHKIESTPGKGTVVKVEVPS